MMLYRGRHEGLHVSDLIDKLTSMVPLVVNDGFCKLRCYVGLKSTDRCAN